MHTASQLSAGMFRIELGRGPASLRQLLSGWTAASRLGVVVREPLGALGASFLMQAATVAFYDARPRRRRRPLYAEIFLFHVGDRFGSHAPLDIWPPRKEVFVGFAAQDLLAAINNCAITHLALPEAPVRVVKHHYKEPDAALDRMKAAWLYAAGGRVADGDVTIAVRDGPALDDIETAIWPEALLEAVEAGPVDDHPKVAEKRRFANSVRSRYCEVAPEDRERMARRRAELRTNDAALETYRRIPIAEAIARL